MASIFSVQNLQTFLRRKNLPRPPGPPDPPGRPPADMTGENLRRSLNHRRLGRFIHLGLSLGICISMSDHFISASANAVDDLRKMFANCGIQQMAKWESKFVHQVEDAPYPDPQTIIAPGKIAYIWRWSRCRRSMP